MTDPYGVDAAFYDLVHPAGGEDCSLWMALAGRTERPVLEIGTGTGRVALELASAGHRVRAVDPSPAMLAIARAKADELGLIIDFGEGSLAGIPARPGDDYGLALVPADVFLHCGDSEEQLSALRALGQALAPDGRLAIDLPGPARYLDGLHNGEPVLVYSADDEGGDRLEAWQVHEDDLAAQTRTLSMRYERTKPDGTTTRAFSEHRLRYVYRFEMEHLLALAGLRTLALYGDYGLGELTHESERMIFVAGRGHQ